MKPESIIEKICTEFPGILPKASWGETSLFYNPGRLLPNGVYFCTIKEKDGENDKASALYRNGVFRVAFSLTPKTYEKLFGNRPLRPAKGGIVSTGHDFTAINKIMPHPVYGWMSWCQILSPTDEKFAEIFPLIVEAYQLAVDKFERKIAKK